MDPKATAASMAERYRLSSYSARERATDHAFAHDYGTLGRAFWLAVVAELDRLAD